MEDKAAVSGEAMPKRFEEMDTTQQVRHLKMGFGLFVPDRFRKRVGLDSVL